VGNSAGLQKRLLQSRTALPMDNGIETSLNQRSSKVLAQSFIFYN
jgi:hypothetical protein